MEHDTLARVGVGLELLVVVSQALVAMWFFRLFRDVDAWAAGSIAAFGLLNAVAIMTSAAALMTAVEVAGSGGESAYLMHVLSDALWGVGGLFFGLWLIPMGWCVLKSATMPRVLGWILVVGGAGYLLGAFVGSVLPDSQGLADALALPVTVGELWMVGYLLVGAGRFVPRRTLEFST